MNVKPTKAHTNLAKVYDVQITESQTEERLESIEERDESPQQNCQTSLPKDLKAACSGLEYALNKKCAITRSPRSQQFYNIAGQLQKLGDSWINRNESTDEVGCASVLQQKIQVNKSVEVVNVVRYGPYNSDESTVLKKQFSAIAEKKSLIKDLVNEDATLPMLRSFETKFDIKKCIDDELRESKRTSNVDDATDDSPKHTQSARTIASTSDESCIEYVEKQDIESNFDSVIEPVFDPLEKADMELKKLYMRQTKPKKITRNKTNKRQSKSSIQSCSSSEMSINLTGFSMKACQLEAPKEHIPTSTNIIRKVDAYTETDCQMLDKGTETSFENCESIVPIFKHFNHPEKMLEIIPLPERRFLYLVKSSVDHTNSETLIYSQKFCKHWEEDKEFREGLKVLKCFAQLFGKEEALNESEENCKSLVCALSCLRVIQGIFKPKSMPFLKHIEDKIKKKYLNLLSLEAESQSYFTVYYRVERGKAIPAKSTD